MKRTFFLFTFFLALSPAAFADGSGPSSVPAAPKAYTYVIPIGSKACLDRFEDAIIDQMLPQFRAAHPNSNDLEEPALDEMIKRGLRDGMCVNGIVTAISIGNTQDEILNAKTFGRTLTPDEMYTIQLTGDLHSLPLFVRVPRDDFFSLQGSLNNWQVGDAAKYYDHNAAFGSEIMDAKIIGFAQFRDGTDLGGAYLLQTDDSIVAASVDNMLNGKNKTVACTSWGKMNLCQGDMIYDPTFVDNDKHIAAGGALGLFQGVIQAPFQRAAYSSIYDKNNIEGFTASPFKVTANADGSLIGTDVEGTVWQLK